MTAIKWTEPALDNLDDIAAYIALSNVEAAGNLVQAIFEKVDKLEQHPLSGRRIPEIKHLDYREVIVPPCRIFYKLIEKDIYVLHVMRQEQELKRFLLKHN